ncbi:hypothetical protein F7725_002729 [Dissostichus mawsoni]|uniref:Uncharacterized protein n=1 Tax=Dissostichus mawsoni TaxID=36200 RepID=A0A7J5Y3D9_DISMA|nr:hypothetical protein F7725_002729 [Dissostichus mawsoni]
MMPRRQTWAESLNNTKRYSNKNTKNKSELWPDSEEKPTSVRDEVTLNPADVMRRPQQTTRCDLRSTTTVTTTELTNLLTLFIKTFK